MLAGLKHVFDIMRAPPDQGPAVDVRLIYMSFVLPLILVVAFGGMAMLLISFFR